jgi:nitrile hydratase accessory protein
LRPLDGAQALMAELTSIPRSKDEPVFAEPWQAQIFAMAVSLHAKGTFTWKEWADRLAKEITAAQSAGDPDLGDTYYSHWLNALERLAVEKGLLDRVTLSERRNAWDRAARATPHGQPIVLGRERS